MNAAAADDTAVVPPRLIGMVHLAPLPGSPRFSGDFEADLERAVEDAQLLTDAGFHALMVENYGDVPFFADDVPKVTVAAMARAVATLRAAVPVPLGVNVLRNDGLAALSIAATCGAQFIRVNVLAGSMYTDQGLIWGKAAEIARARAAWAPDVEILADVFVKHASPPPGLTVEEAAADTFHRGLADALIVSGSATGKAPDQKMIERVRAAVPDATILIGSGSTRRTAARLLSVADGLIVGTDVKRGGIAEAPVDAKRAVSMVKAATPETSSPGGANETAKEPARAASGGRSPRSNPKGTQQKAGAAASASDQKASGRKASGQKASGQKASGQKASGQKASGQKGSTQKDQAKPASGSRRRRSSSAKQTPPTPAKSADADASTSPNRSRTTTRPKS